MAKLLQCGSSHYAPLSASNHHSVWHVAAATERRCEIRPAGKHDRDTRAKATPLAASVLCLLYGVGVGVLTFDGPYTEAGNGYFFSWAAFLSALHAVYLSIEPVSTTPSRPSSDPEGLVLFFFSSVRRIDRVCA